MEKRFQCPNCQTVNTVIFDSNENQRNIPCIGCYYETWSVVDGTTVKTCHGVRLLVKRNGSLEVAEQYDE